MADLKFGHYTGLEAMKLRGWPLANRAQGKRVAETTGLRYSGC